MSDEFARPPNSNPHGKCTVRIDIPCSEKLKEDLTGIAFMHKQTLSEYLRDVLEVHAWGALSIRDKVVRIPRYDDGNNEQ